MTVKPGDRFILEPNDYFRVKGTGLLWNRSTYPVILELEREVEVRDEG